MPELSWGRNQWHALVHFAANSNSLICEFVLHHLLILLRYEFHNCRYFIRFMKRRPEASPDTRLHSQYCIYEEAARGKPWYTSSFTVLYHSIIPIRPILYLWRGGHRQAPIHVFIHSIVFMKRRPETALIHVFIHSIVELEMDVNGRLLPIFRACQKLEINNFAWPPVVLLT